MKHKIIVLLSVALFSSAALADVAEQPNYSNQFFAGVGTGYGISNYSDSDFNEIINNPLLTSNQNSVTSKSSKDGAYYTAEFGYMLTQHYGLDFEYLKKVTKPSFAFNNAAGQQGSATLDFDMYILSLLASFPLNNKISFSAQAGYVYTVSDLDFNSTGANMTGINKINSHVSSPMVGIGANYKLTTHFALKVEYKHIFENKNDTKLDTTSGNIGSGLASPSVDLVDAGIRYYF